MTQILLAAAGALFFLLGTQRTDSLLDLFAYTVSSWVLIIFLFFDLRYWLVPKGFAIFTLGLSLFLGLIGVGLSFGERLFGALSGFLFLWCLLVVSTWVLRRISRLGLSEYAMGAGDPLMICVIGSIFGLFALPGILFLASVQSLFFLCLPRILGAKPLRAPWSSAGPASPLAAFMCLASLELLAMPELPVRIRVLLFG